MRMRILFTMSRCPLALTLLVAPGVSAFGQAEAPARPATKATVDSESATKPAPRAGNWLTMHERFLDRAKQGNIDLLFLGDSITAGWNGKNREGEGPRQVWDRYYEPRHAANFGIGGDRTQHVLWRIENGEIDGIKPKVVVLMIGTNNLRANTQEEIADGITAIVKTLRETLPESKILLLGVFPRGAKADDRARDRIKDINRRIRKLDDGSTVRYLDIGERFLESDGAISKEIMPDYLHLSRKGYTIWADAIEPTLHAMLEGN
jgi:lysophospholipase L1-like esterase